MIKPFITEFFEKCNLNNFIHILFFVFLLQFLDRYLDLMLVNVNNCFSKGAFLQNLNGMTLYKSIVSWNDICWIIVRTNE